MGRSPIYRESLFFMLDGWEVSLNVIIPILCVDAMVALSMRTSHITLHRASPVLPGFIVHWSIVSFRNGKLHPLVVHCSQQHSRHAKFTRLSLKERRRRRKPYIYMLSVTNLEDEVILSPTFLSPLPPKHDKLASSKYFDVSQNMCVYSRSICSHSARKDSSSVIEHQFRGVWGVVEETQGEMWVEREEDKGLGKETIVEILPLTKSLWVHACWNSTYRAEVYTRNIAKWQ